MLQTTLPAKTSQSNTTSWFIHHNTILTVTTRHILHLTFLLNFWVIQFTSTWPCAFWFGKCMQRTKPDVVMFEVTNHLNFLRLITLQEVSCVLYGYVVVIKSITSCMGIDYCRSHLRTGNWKVCCIYILHRICCVSELSYKKSKNTGLLATQCSIKTATQNKNQVKPL